MDTLYLDQEQVQSTDTYDVQHHTSALRVCPVSTHGYLCN